MIADHLSRDITNDSEYIDYTHNHQEMNYMARDLFTMDDRPSIVSQQIVRRSFANTPVRRSNGLKNEKSVDHQFPDESDIHLKSDKGKSTEVFLFKHAQRQNVQKTKSNNGWLIQIRWLII